MRSASLQSSDRAADFFVRNALQRKKRYGGLLQEGYKGWARKKGEREGSVRER